MSALTESGRVLGLLVVVLGIIIFVHELGHFAMAKLRRIRVLVFSLGFGPAMFKFRRGETEYRLAWFPLGGYVQMAGDSLDEDGGMPAGGPDEYLTHPWYGRILVALAGPGANLVAAYLIAVVTLMTGVSTHDQRSELGAVADTSQAHAAGFRTGDLVVALGGKPVETWMGMEDAAAGLSRDGELAFVVERAGARVPVTVPAAERQAVLRSLQPPATAPVVGSVLTGMPAYRAGMKAGDRILAVDGAPVATWQELRAAVGARVDRPVALRVERDGRAFDLAVTPMNSGDGGGGVIGIEAPRDLVYTRRLALLPALRWAVPYTRDVIAGVCRGMWLTISRPFYYGQYVGGPLYIAQAASEQARRGVDSFLQFLAMINVAVMAFNLLPLPVLDGGHVVMAVLQGVRRRPVSARGYLRFQRAGMVVLGGLLILVLVNDPLRIVRRQVALSKAPQEQTVAPSPP